MEATFGVRNLFNVTNIETTAFNGGTLHGNSSSNILLGYGRSYFLKFNYNFSL
jgi:outer membrane receptor for ferrienterochelin and colicins